MKKRQVRRYEHDHPESKVLVADATKARRMDVDKEVQREAGWITARRAILMLTKDALICGDWVIPLNQIDSVSLLEIKQGIFRGYVLKVVSKENHYQFGLSYNPEWQTQSHFPLKAESATVGYSKFSSLLRIVRFVSVFIFLGWIFRQLF